MISNTNLVLVANAVALTGQTASNAAIQHAYSLVEDYIGRDLQQKVVVDEWNGSQTKLILSHFPIVSNVVVNGNTASTVNYVTGVVTGTFEGPTVTATYTAGYEPLPAGVIQAVAVLATSQDNSSGLLGIRSESFGGYSVTYGNDASAIIPRPIASILDKYKDVNL